jgi:hypothetical protein
MAKDAKVVYTIESEEAFVSKILENPQKDKLLVLDIFTEWLGHVRNSFRRSSLSR